jgi:DNA polymerase III subunit delta
MAAGTAKADAPVALICGEDDFAVKQHARELYHKWTGELGGMDHEVIEARVGNSGEALKALAKLREALQTLPFFGGGKAIWLRDCNFLGDDRTASSGAVTDTLAEIAQELKQFNWQNVRLLISAGKVDKRKVFYKTLEKLGRVESFDGWDERDWVVQAELMVRKSIQASGKTIAEEALAELSCPRGSAPPATGGGGRETRALCRRPPPNHLPGCCRRQHQKQIGAFVCAGGCAGQSQPDRTTARPR